MDPLNELEIKEAIQRAAVLDNDYLWDLLFAIYYLIDKDLGWYKENFDKETVEWQLARLQEFGYVKLVRQDKKVIIKINHTGKEFVTSVIKNHLSGTGGT